MKRAWHFRKEFPPVALVPSRPKGNYALRLFRRATRVFLVLSILALCVGGCATLDQKDKSILQQKHVPPLLYDRMLAGAPLSLPDIIELSHREVPTPLVIHYLNATGTVYYLKTRDVTHLLKSGVSQKVIDYLLNTPLFFAGYAAYAAPPYYPYNPFWYPYGPYYYSSPRPPVFIPDHHRRDGSHWR